MGILNSFLGSFFNPPSKDFVGMVPVVYRGNDPRDFSANQQALVIAIKGEATFLKTSEESSGECNLENDGEVEDTHSEFAGFPIC